MSILFDLSSVNRDLNRGCLVYMYSLRFSGSNFLLNLLRQLRVRKILHAQVFAGSEVFSFVFKIAILRLRNLCSRLLFH